MSTAFKRLLIAQIIQKIERDVELLSAAALEAREAATHEESKAEDKYDTRGLEASYLAGAQAKRAAELLQLIQFFKFMELHSFNEATPIASTALIEIQSGDKKNLLFIVPKGGGFDVEVEAKNVQVITTVSPLGEDLIGKSVGDEFERRFAGQIKSYEILHVE